MPRTAQKLLLLTPLLATFNSYVASLAPVGWWKMVATAGTNEADAGSGGSALDMTILSATLGQSSPLGANTAFLLDGANSRLQTPNNAALAALTTWEWAFLVNPSSAGEVNFGQFYCWGNGTAGDDFTQFNGSINQISTGVYNTVPTAFSTVTTTGLSISTWSMLFVAYNDSGDRKVHLYKGVSGAVTEFSYSAQPALTGTYRAQTSVLNLFNTTSQGFTFAGLGGATFAVNGNLSAAQRLKLTQLAKV